MKKWIIIGVLLVSGTVWACVDYKQCCRRELKGLECITKCGFEWCPFDFPIEIK